MEGYDCFFVGAVIGGEVVTLGGGKALEGGDGRLVVSNSVGKLEFFLSGSDGSVNGEI